MTEISVVGIAESDHGVVPDKSVREIHAQAAFRALDDAGLSMRDVDGLFCGSSIGGMMPIVGLAEYFGITPRYSDSSNVGGSVWEFFVEHAVAALEHRLCDVALVVYGSKFRSDTGRSLGTGQRFSTATGPAAFEDP